MKQKQKWNEIQHFAQARIEKYRYEAAAEMKRFSVMKSSLENYVPTIFIQDSEQRLGRISE